MDPESIKYDYLQIDELACTIRITDDRNSYVCGIHTIVIRPTGGATFKQNCVMCVPVSFSKMRDSSLQRAVQNYNKGNDWIFKYINHIPNNTKTYRIQCVRRARLCSMPNTMILQLRKHCIKNQFRCIMLHVSIIKIEYFHKCNEIYYYSCFRV